MKKSIPHAGLQPAASRLEVWRAVHCANGAEKVGQHLETSGYLCILFNQKEKTKRKLKSWFKIVTLPEVGFEPTQS